MRSSSRRRVFRYKALAFSQRPNHAGAPRFILFHAPAGEVVKWADVDRIAPNNPTGAQRPLRKLKVNKVARFLSADKSNTIPTAIIVALDEESVAFEGGKGGTSSGGVGTLVIRVENEPLPGLIIDGQHRAFGADKFSPEMPLNVVAFLGGDDAERAFQFVVINNTSARVSKDHIKALNLNYDREGLNQRLLSSAGLGLDEDKYDDLQVLDRNDPFKGLIEWPRNQDGFIPPNALESGLAETRDRVARLGIEGLERDVFLAIWSKIKELRPDEWKPWPQSHLLQKVSIYALTVFILDNLVAAQTVSEVSIDFTDDQVLGHWVEKLVRVIPPAFWTAEWTMTELDTRSGRAALVNAFQVIASNVKFGRGWYEDLSIIDPGTVSGSTFAPKRVVRRRRVAKKK